MLKIRYLVGLPTIVLILGTCGDPPLQAPENGSIQLFFDVNIDGAGSIGLQNLTSMEIKTTRVTAKLNAEGFQGKVKNTSWMRVGKP